MAHSTSSQLYTDELETLLIIQQAITSHLELSEVLQLIVVAAQRLTSARLSLLYVLEGADLRIAAVAGQENAKELIGYRIPIAESVAGLSIQTKQLLMITDVQADARVYREAADRFGLRSYLAVPLLSEDRPVGVIAVADENPHTLGPDSQRILSMLASGAVIGLENARLYHQEQERRVEAERRRQVAESLRDILASLNSNYSLAEILTYIVSQANNRLLDCQAMAIFCLQAEAKVLTIQAAQGLPADFTASARFLVGHGAIGKAVLTRQPVPVADAGALVSGQTDLVLTPAERDLLVLLSTHYLAWLAIPLIVTGEIYGGLVLFYRAPRHFSEEEINLALTFCAQVALAIENTGLRAQAEQAAVMAERNRLARELHDAVTQTLFSAGLIAEVLPHLWERNQAEGRRRLEELRQLTHGALAEMRMLLFELRPTAFKEARLGELLTHLTEAASGRMRIPITLTVEGDRSLLPEVQLALYRITQEALNNIAKHANSSRAEVSLQFLAEQVKLIISDNGCGFNPVEVSAEHLGLSIMRERAAAIKAKMKLTSQSGCGTEVEVVWPDSAGRKRDG